MGIITQNIVVKLRFQEVKSRLIKLNHCLAAAEPKDQ